ncbi:hypothetical protein [Mesobacillus jeotgali]|uniref:hypothetical protein n=1 Tax=Mesobacillus jeotgali TaxID=129985 RepID=UPI000C822B90|nr:hypothetical protein [Mesobacillus jeotgali]
MKSNNMFKFIEDIIPANAMVEGDNFEIISFFTFNHDTQEVSPADISNNDIHFNSLEEAICVKGGNISLVRTPFNPESTLHFYRLKSKINYTLAISLGFGIVKLTDSKRPNDFLLYYFNYLDDEEQMMSPRPTEQWFLLKCYLQLTEEGRFHEPKLEIYIEENQEYLMLLMHGNPPLLLKKILMAVDKYKGELIILQSKPRKFKNRTHTAER